jgi:mannosyl-3-phosphoglycerate phosphatase family protein
MKQIIVFTDLDGTLLDSFSYSFEKALPALELLKKGNIPLVLCSSKTRAEIEHYRIALGNDHPFISENGGGIFIPKGYFGVEASCVSFHIETEDGYELIRLGASYPDLRKAIGELRREGYAIRGFGDMTEHEIARLANMSISEARMAKERNFDEPFLFEGTEGEVMRLTDAIQEKGVHITQGRFFHLLGNSDKGKAISILKGFYRKKYDEILTVAIGDSPNDIPMLKEVHYPIIVQKPDGHHDPRIDIPNLLKAEGVGPEGWNRALLLNFKNLLK